MGMLTMFGSILTIAGLLLIVVPFVTNFTGLFVATPTTGTFSTTESFYILTVGGGLMFLGLFLIALDKR